MNKEKAFSYTRGYSFLFEYDGTEIKAWCSALSGLEKVYVDGKLVSSQRNLSTNSSKSFTTGPNEYTTNLNVTSLLKGPFASALNNNGKECKRQKLSFSRAKSNGLPLIAGFSFSILSGVIFKFAYSYWQLPGESIYLFIVVLFFVVLFYQPGIDIKGIAVIEDEKMF